VHINLWLDKGNPPVNGQPVEVVLTQFEYVPLGPPPPATITKINGLPGGPVLLNAQGATDWRYQILASTNLSVWSNLGTVLATNSLLQFTDTNPVSPTSRFYRLQTGP
jgi:hypothetical protein